MGKIEFDAEKHEYTWEGQKIPSVSDILAPLSAERYAEINPAVLQQAAARGTAVHEICEAMDYGLDPEIEPGLEGYAQAYSDFLRDYFPKWELIEQIVYYRVNGEVYTAPPLFCGTVDRYGTIDDKPAVLDIKTYASLTTDSMIYASCQTAMYAGAIFDDIRDNIIKKEQLSLSVVRYLLHLKKDGSYRLVDLNKFDMERDFDSTQVSWLLRIMRQEIDNARNWKKGKK